MFHPPGKRTATSMNARSVPGGPRLLKLVGEARSTVSSHANSDATVSARRLPSPFATTAPLDKRAPLPMTANDRRCNPRWHYENEPETRAALDLIFSDHFSRYETGVFSPLRDTLLTNGDHCMHLAD